MSTRNSIMSLGIIALVVLVHPVSVPAALVDHYEFEGNGVDSQGGDANGANVGTVSYATGQIGLALDATDVNGADYIAVPQANAFDPGSGDFSMAFWSQRSTFNDFDTAFDALSGTGVGYQALFMNNSLSNKLRVRLDDDDGKTKNIDTVFQFNDTEFRHVAVVVDRVADTFTYYVDGTAETPVNIAVLTGSITPNQQLSLGISHDGKIDDLRFYNHALTEAEVTALIPEPATIPEPDIIVTTPTGTSTVTSATRP